MADQGVTIHIERSSKAKASSKRRAAGDDRDSSVDEFHHTVKRELNGLGSAH